MTHTPYHVKVAPAAFRQIKSLPQKTRKLIYKIAETLAINPRPPGAQKIEGMTGLYCEDVQHLRLIYKIEDQEIWVLLVNCLIKHRKVLIRWRR